jgi:Sec-independent protein translocase protein TatA
MAAMLTVPVLALFDVGSGELFIIALVALLLYGGRLPEVARTLGRTVSEWKRHADNLTREFRQDLYDPRPGRPAKPRRPAVPYQPKPLDAPNSAPAAPPSLAPPAEPELDGHDSSVPTEERGGSPAPPDPPPPPSTDPTAANDSPPARADGGGP